MPMLKKGQRLVSADGQPIDVVSLIASGGQGEVYTVQMNGQNYALKWYHHPSTPAQKARSREQYHALEQYLLLNSPPDHRFLWPMTMVKDPRRQTFGYIMPLLEPRFQGLEHLVLGKMRPAPSFRVLCHAAISLAECFRKLHNMGACYKDINLGGPFLDPQTGEVRICDTDNVRVNKTPGNIIFVYFAAPELILNEGTCQTNTDIHSLAVLLFYMFIRHHPLEGARELEINVFNEVAQRKFYGSEPLFIFHPKDSSNRPVPGFHDTAIRNWDIYPSFLQRMFVRAFTDGLTNPNHRVREGEWMEAFSRLRDSLYYCRSCGAETFFDFERASLGHQQNCWKCGATPHLPFRIDIGHRQIFLNHDSELFPHHLGSRLDFSAPMASISQHPKDPRRWGLKNHSDTIWEFIAGDGQTRLAKPGQSIPLKHGLTIRFGQCEGQILSR
ncbi:MAG: protein kinase domain-containing protein [Myxococcota bacterium]